jgi:predicted regulator of Ras-like GTPase activity (Roadblock/LC7/MglB family)
MENVKALVDRPLVTVGSPAADRTTVDPAVWTAPVRPVADCPLPTPALSDDPVSVLDELVRQVDGVHGAVLASVDGFGLARSSSMADEASHPAMLAAAVGIARQLVAMCDGNALRQLVVDHDGGLLLVWPIGAQRVLAVLASSTVEQRRVRAFVKAEAAPLSGVAA